MTKSPSTGTSKILGLVVYSALTLNISVLAATGIAILVYWKLGGAIAALLSLYSGHMEPIEGTPQFPMHALLVWIFACFSLGWHRKYPFLIGLSSLFGLIALFLVLRLQWELVVFVKGG